MRLESLLLLGIFTLSGCVATMAQNPSPNTVLSKPTPAGQKSLVVGGGCFWCIDAQFRMLKGVSEVVSGYSGGTESNPTYEEVCSGATGHAEAVKVTFDPKTITEADLLRIFFTVHDPTTLNRQGPDEGSQYRSVIFFQNDEEKALAQRVIAEINREKIWPGRIVTTLEPFQAFYPAEEYHQDYFNKFEKAGTVQKMGMNSGYCRLIIEPKVKKFKQKFAKLLK